MEKAPMLLWLQISHFQIQIHNKHSNFLVLKPTQLDNHRASISKLSFLLSSMELLHKTTAFSWTHTISTSLHLPQPHLSLVSTHFLYFLFFLYTKCQSFAFEPGLFADQFGLYLWVQRYETKRLRVWCVSDQTKVCSSELECLFFYIFKMFC